MGCIVLRVIRGNFEIFTMVDTWSYVGPVPLPVLQLLKVMAMDNFV